MPVWEWWWVCVLLRSGPRAGARLVTGSSGVAREGSRANRPGAVDLEWDLAQVDDCAVFDQRSDLVDSFLGLPVRCVASLQAIERSTDYADYTELLGSYNQTI